MAHPACDAQKLFTGSYPMGDILPSQLSHTNSFGSAELITQFSYEQISWYTYQTNVANTMHYVGHATSCIELTVDDLVK